jgi:hypothetical protein
MSFPKKGKSFPKKGKSFPKRGGGGGSDFSLDDHAFAMKIASALTSELKNRNSRAKLVAGCHSACNIGSDAILVQFRLFCAD